jgi:hypothetical protein
MYAFILLEVKNNVIAERRNNTTKWIMADAPSLREGWQW